MLHGHARRQTSFVRIQDRRERHAVVRFDVVVRDDERREDAVGVGHRVEQVASDERPTLSAPAESTTPPARPYPWMPESLKFSAYAINAGGRPTCSIPP